MKTVNPVVTEVIGLQYGDEGKSNISCLESSDAKLLIRATGGSNSSHTIECECSMYNSRIIPSGIVNKKTVCILGPGMAIDPKMLLNEIWLLKTAGIAVSRKNLIISDRARVILPYHKKLDAYYESLKQNTLTGLLDGSESVYASKAKHVGLRMADILSGNWDKIKEELETLPQDFIDQYSQWYSTERERKISIQVLTEEMSNLCQDYRLQLHSYIRDVQEYIKRIIYSGCKIVVEGASSYGLDIDLGEYPYCSSFASSSSSLIAQAGIGPLNVKEIIGVAKAYNTKPTNGQFITEVKGQTEKVFKDFTAEYDSAIRSPKRYGWLDLVQLKNAVRENSVSKLAVTHIDTIGAIGVALGCIKVCVGYKVNDHTLYYMPINCENIKPIYQYLDPWVMPQGGCHSFEQLPKGAKDFIHLIETMTGVEVAIIGTGPKKQDLIIRR